MSGRGNNPENAAQPVKINNFHSSGAGTYEITRRSTNVKEISRGQENSRSNCKS